jgi:hypothetical protein
MMLQLDAIYGISRAQSSVNPVTLVQSWRKLLPDLDDDDDDLQGFPNEESSKSEILDMVCAIINFENINEDNTEERLQRDAMRLNWAFSTWTVSMLLQNTREKKRGEDESEEEGRLSMVVSVSHSMALQCVDNLLDFMGQRGFEYSEITATRKICIAVSRHLNSYKNMCPL